MEMFQTSFWTCSFQVVQESEIIWIGKWLPLILSSHSLIELSLTNRNSSSTLVWPDWFNIPCPHCLQCQPFMTNLELDGIELILTITSQVISKQMKWVMWYNKKKNLQHHNSWKRITLLWWQWGILKLFAPNQPKDFFLFNVWWMSMKRAMPPFEQGIQNYSKMILTSLRQVRICWCACPLTSLLGWRIKIGLILTTNGWPGWWGIWRKLNQATSNRSDL